MHPFRRFARWFDSHENRVLLSALAAGFAAVAFSLVVLWTGEYSSKVQWTLTILIAGLWLGFSFSARERVVNPLRTIANLLEAIREGDYSIRGRGAREGEALGEVMVQVNEMGATLRAQRLGAVEASALLSKVMEEIDVAVFTFDPDEKLRFVNHAGERLLARSVAEMMGASADSLGLAELLRFDQAQAVSRAFPGGAGRWGIRQSAFREGGLPLKLLVVSDLTRALREEELQAWQRLVRVLGHELNNSLAPIKSISGSLSQLITRSPRPDDWEEDARQGLGVIASRAEALDRFIGAYSRLAKLPRPRLAPVEIHPLIHRAASLELRLPVRVEDGPAITLRADADQLEQLLINLVRNAADAALETGGGVTLKWDGEGRWVRISVLDEGMGISNTGNLFVPFFTTKPGGSGIGLVLSRQIAEAHGGTLTLANRGDARGSRAELALPV